MYLEDMIRCLKASVIVFVFYLKYVECYPVSGHTTKLHHKYLPPDKFYINTRPEIAAAAQYVQYGGPTGGKYKGSPYGNPRFQGSYDTSKRFYGVISVSIPLIVFMGIMSFLPTMTTVSKRKKRSIDGDGFNKDRQDLILKTFYRAMEEWKRIDGFQVEERRRRRRSLRKV